MAQIKNQVSELPEVGYSLVRAAELLDRRERALAQQQQALAEEQQEFKNSLLEYYNPAELVAAGIFGFSAAIANAIWEETAPGVFKKH